MVPTLPFFLREVMYPFNRIAILRPPANVMQPAYELVLDDFLDMLRNPQEDDAAELLEMAEETATDVMVEQVCQAERDYKIQSRHIREMRGESEWVNNACPECHGIRSGLYPYEDVKVRQYIDRTYGSRLLSSHGVTYHYGHTMECSRWKQYWPVPKHDPDKLEWETGVCPECLGLEPGLTREETKVATKWSHGAPLHAGPYASCSRWKKYWRT